MQEPCKASDAGRNSDEDLQSDVETMECLRQLRLDKYRWQAYYSALKKFSRLTDTAHNCM
ncbi:hypothetical protein ACH50_14570 [Franconibacter pulveris]|uniref:Uncharacterized protein n=1 Tax=Franconibacter pulveris TaxID=435910 RepID=A0A0J8VLM1_9ENTR|nr:hypothetical protein ACH50_14570 [Franconibacter pulveris]